LNTTYTPSSSGRLLIIAAGVAQNITGGGGQATQVFGFYGTGTPPTASAALGSNLGQWGLVQRTGAAASANWVGFTVIGILTCSVGTAYWFDVVLNSDGGTGAGVRDVQFVLLEV
jgi:hypothetical protein